MPYFSFFSYFLKNVLFRSMPHVLHMVFQHNWFRILSKQILQTFYKTDINTHVKMKMYNAINETRRSHHALWSINSFHTLIVGFSYLSYLGRHYQNWWFLDFIYPRLYEQQARFALFIIDRCLNTVQTFKHIWHTKYILY